MSIVGCGGGWWYVPGGMVQNRVDSLMTDVESVIATSFAFVFVLLYVVHISVYGIMSGSVFFRCGLYVTITTKGNRMDPITRVECNKSRYDTKLVYMRTCIVPCHIYTLYCVRELNCKSGLNFQINRSKPLAFASIRRQAHIKSIKPEMLMLMLPYTICTHNIYKLIISSLHTHTHTRTYIEL